jgi:dTDP-D-glucose 4,6-dehydratase
MRLLITGGMGFIGSHFAAESHVDHSILDPPRFIRTNVLGTQTLLEAIRFVPDRLGHDRRYAINSTKIRRELGWRPGYSLDEGLIVTLEWYEKNKKWWQAILHNSYRSGSIVHTNGGDKL